MNKELIGNILISLDPEDLITLLEITNEEIFEAFEHKFEEHRGKFEEDFED